MSSHTLKELDNGYWRLTYLKDGDYADFETEKGAIAYLQNINRIFRTDYTVEGYVW